MFLTRFVKITLVKDKKLPYTLIPYLDVKFVGSLQVTIVILHNISAYSINGYIHVLALFLKIHGKPIDRKRDSG